MKLIYTSKISCYLLLLLLSISTSAKNQENINEVKSNKINEKNAVQSTAGNSFWSLAKEVKPESVTQYQAMAALMRKNPEAFNKGSYQNIKPNAVLKLPSLAEYASEPVDIAKKYFEEQNASAKISDSAPKLYNLTNNDHPSTKNTSANKEATDKKSTTNPIANTTAKADLIKNDKTENNKSETIKTTKSLPNKEDLAKVTKSEHSKVIATEKKVEIKKIDIVKSVKADNDKAGIAKTIKPSENKTVKTEKIINTKNTAITKLDKPNINKEEVASIDSTPVKLAKTANTNSTAVKLAKTENTEPAEFNPPTKEVQINSVKSNNQDDNQVLDVKSSDKSVADTTVNNNASKDNANLEGENSYKLPNNLPVATAKDNNNPDVTVLNFPPPEKVEVGTMETASAGMKREDKIQIVMIIAAIVGFLGLLATIGSKFIRFGKSDKTTKIKSADVIAEKSSKKNNSENSSDDLLFGSYTTTNFDQSVSEQLLKSKSTSKINQQENLQNNTVTNHSVATQNNNLPKATENIVAIDKIVAEPRIDKIVAEPRIDLLPTNASNSTTAFDQQNSSKNSPVINQSTLNTNNINENKPINEEKIEEKSNDSAIIQEVNQSENSNYNQSKEINIVAISSEDNHSESSSTTEIAQTPIESNPVEKVLNNIDNTSENNLMPINKSPNITQGGLPLKPQEINFFVDNKYPPSRKVEAKQSANKPNQPHEEENSSIPQAIGNRKTKMNIVKVLEEVESTLANPNDISSAVQAEEYGKKLLQSDGPDSTAYKLRMAEPYFELGLDDLAFELLQEVSVSGSQQQQQEAEQLINKYANRKK